MKGKKYSMTKSRLKRIATAFIAAILTGTSVFGVSAAAKSLEYSASDSYKSSVYYERLMKVKLTGDQVTDIVNVAKSQVGYHEASYSNYSGTSTGSGNITEYGRWYGRQGYWCNVFASWCGYVAGIPTSIYPKLTSVGNSYYSTLPSVGADCFSFSSGRKLRAGDLVFCCTCSGGYGCIDHVGLVVDADENTIYTVEGNMSDQVMACEYPASTGYSSRLHARINYVARPQYESNCETVSTLTDATAVKIADNSIYAVFDVTVNYEQAKELSEKMGGQLVNIDSENELTSLSELAGENGFGRYFIGESINNKKNQCLVITDDGVSKSSEKRSRTGFICELDISEIDAVNCAVLNGTKYEIYDTSMTYAQAKAFAEAKGGSLARINESNEKMLSILLKGSDKYFVTSTDENSAKALLNDGTAEVENAKSFDENGGTGFIVEYSETKKFTVIYSGNGGENAPIEKVAEYGETVFVSPLIPQNKSKTFMGWSFDKDAKTAEVHYGDTIKVTENVTLYAVWG
ncbi:MAG: InlB B-repeat-containing protein [Acutalibacteraceae bacterium]